MGSGRAFSIGGDAGEEVPVFKSWGQLEGRTFLIEEVPLPSIQPGLEQLAPSAAPKTGAALPKDSALYVVSAQRLLPTLRKITNTGDTIRLAQAGLMSGNGFVLDYQILNGSATNFVFQGDTTYFVSGAYNLSGVTTIEGGAVIKYTNTSSAKVSFSGPLDCRTGPYRPAVFTSRDDQSVGEIIGTNTPTQTSAVFLEDTSNADNAYRHLRFSYAKGAVSSRPTSSYSTATNYFWNCQFIQCGTAVSIGTCTRQP